MSSEEDEFDFDVEFEELSGPITIRVAVTESVERPLMLTIVQDIEGEPENVSMTVVGMSVEVAGQLVRAIQNVIAFVNGDDIDEGVSLTRLH